MRTAVPACPIPGPAWVVALLCLLPHSASAQLTCRWQAAPAVSAADTPGCLQPVADDGPLLTLPSNASSLSQRGIVLCRGTWNPSPRAVDVVFLMDNSGSMEAGENAGGFDTPPGDPFGIRDRAIRLAMRQLHHTGGDVTAGFLSFYGLGNTDNYTVTPEIELEKIQPPLDIGFPHPQGRENLATLTRKVWKHNPNEALLPKVSARAKGAKTALTYWSESLLRARSWFSPESGFVKSPNHAIILLSDGAIGDWRDVQNLAPSLPPVHGIHLGGESNAIHLRDLATLTGGSFQVVSQVDTQAILAAYRAIAFRLTGTLPPESTWVRHSRTGSDTTWVLTAAAAGVDSGGNLVLDLGGELALGGGIRATHIHYPSAPALDFGFRTQATGPALSAGNPHFQCWDPASIRSRGPILPASKPPSASRRDALGKQHPLPDGSARPARRLFTERKPGG